MGRVMPFSYWQITKKAKLSLVLFFMVLVCATPIFAMTYGGLTDEKTIGLAIGNAVLTIRNGALSVLDIRLTPVPIPPVPPSAAMVQVYNLTNNTYPILWAVIPFLIILSIPAKGGINLKTIIIVATIVMISAVCMPYIQQTINAMIGS